MYKTILGQELYYQKAGHGTPLILLHGWGNDVTSFWPLIPLLQDRFTLYLIDLPGFGRSSIPNQPFTIDNYVEVLHHFIAQEKITPIVLGHSLGGQIAVALTAKYPADVTKLILEDAAAIREPNTMKKRVYRFLSSLFHLLPNGSFKQRLRHQLYRSLDSDYENAGTMQQTMQRVLSEDLSAKLPSITVPTLILWGQNDSATPLALGKRIYRAIPPAKMEVFESVGHFPHLEATERFCYYVKDFC